MGRGRSGFIDQSMRKTKFQKNRTRTDFEIYHSPNKNQENSQPIILADLVAQMRTMSEEQVRELLIKSLAN